MASNSGTNSRLDSDRYGVPQYGGEVELFEEYEERAMDLYYGREGQEALQKATAIHLRAQLTGSAYEAVRKIPHQKLRTSDAEGKPTTKGVTLLLSTLREQIAQEAPVRVNELFLDYFYSAGVWRKPTETMAQYLVRREYQFTRLKEASPDTTVSDNLKCMLTLLFAGLDAKERQNILASVNNEYDFKKVSHALRIQFPNAIQRPVIRKDYLGAGRGSQPVHALRPKWRAQQRPKSVFAAEGGDPSEYGEGEDAYYDDEYEDDAAEMMADDDGPSYSDDETLEALVGELIPEQLEDDCPTPSDLQEEASGDISFDQKSRDQRKAAVSFIKGVTQCTACGAKGHWSGDSECPKSKGRGRGKGGSKSPSKKPGAKQSPKKPSSTYFVLHDKIESDDEAQDSLNFAVYNMSPESSKATVNDMTPVSNLTSEYAQSPVSNAVSDEFAVSKNAGVFVVFRNTKLCEHTESNGGEERQFHRGANGHTRHVSCRDCDKTILCALRKEPIQLWGYLVQVAMCMRFGKDARYRAFLQRMERVKKEKMLMDKADRSGYPAASPTSPGSGGGSPLKIAKTPPRAARPKRATRPPPRDQIDEWSVVASSPPDSPSARASSDQPPQAKIVYAPQHEAWLYGVHLCLEEELPLFPELSGQDVNILQPLPHHGYTFATGPAQGLTYAVVSSTLDWEPFCRDVIAKALHNEPMTPEVYRFAYYLYGKIKLVRSAAVRMLKGSTDQCDLSLKRPQDVNAMNADRCIYVPIQVSINPQDVTVQQCDVMMVTDSQLESFFALNPEEPPGLAILDSGCTRTMHGTVWASKFEERLSELNLQPMCKTKTQRFRGVGGETVSRVVKIFPIGLGGVHGELHSAETDGDTPLLLSRPFMQSLGAVINLKKNVVSFENIGVTDLPLVRTQRGHLAVNLLDFDCNNMEAFQSLYNEFQDEDLERHSRPTDTVGSQGWQTVPAVEETAWDALPLDQAAKDGVMPGPPVVGTVPAVEETAWDESSWSEISPKSLPPDAACDSDDPYQGEPWDEYQEGHHVERSGSSRSSHQMGLTVMAIFYGVSVGVPLDSLTSDWDATSKKAMPRIHQDMKEEDPYVTVITHPCGPWGNWSNFNIARGGSTEVTVLELRETQRPLLKLVNKVIVDRVKANRHVFVEQPYGSESINEPEMKDVRNLIESGRLLMIKVDGCQLGY
eukprot:s1878_g23.t1